MVPPSSPLSLAGHGSRRLGPEVPWLEVDITALDAVERLRQDVQTRGIVFALARVKQDLLVDLEAFGQVREIGPDRIFPTLATAVAAYQKWRSERSL